MERSGTGLGTARLKIGLALICVLLLVGCSSGSADILFVSNRDGDSELYVMAADGKGVKQLTKNNSEDTTAVWSPDGSRIAFTSNRDGNLEIYVINADGTGEKNLTNHPSQDSNPQWSPDGGRIAFESLREGGNPEVFVMDADGSSPLNVSNDLKRDDGRPRWSPDGSRLVFVKVVGREPDVFLVNLADLNPVNLTNDADIDSAPEWSPDGTRIAYHSVKKRLMNVYVMTIGPNGTSTVNVTDDPIPAGTNTSGQDNFPLWSSDGSKILWTTTRHGPRQEIYVANADGSEPANLTQTPDIEEYGHSWSPDGKKVAFVRLVEGNSEIFVMNSDGTQVVRLTKNPANDVQPLWSPVASTR